MLNRTTFAIIIVMMALFSCKGEQNIETTKKNEVEIPLTVIPYNNKGQFVSIESSQSWQVELSFQQGVETWCEISPMKGEGSASNLRLIYSVNESEADRKVTIKVRFEEGELIEKELVQQYKVIEKPEKPDPTQFTGWGELPDISTDEDMMFVTHRTTIANKKVRNYSMQYDKEHRIATWVAFPMCKMYIGSQKRTDDWTFDPEIPEGLQPELDRGFYSKVGLSGYDRGHQLPSSFRTASYTTNAQTFYYSNATAQNAQLNQNVWMELEQRVKGYSSLCDTMYVVTGPVLKTEQDPDIEYILDKSNNFFTAMPKAYFYVMVKYNLENQTYSAIGFWYENRPYSHRDPRAIDSYSIKDIEERTGLSFFNNLPLSDSDLKKLKNEYSPKSWGLS